MAFLLVPLLTAVTGTGAGTATYPVRKASRSFQAVVTGTGAVTATVVVEVSNDGVNFITMGTITLSGTTLATDGFASFSQWYYVRGNVTAITGTGATINLTMSVDIQ